MKYLLFQPEELEELMQFLEANLDENYNPHIHTLRYSTYIRSQKR